MKIEVKFNYLYICEPYNQVHDNQPQLKSLAEKKAQTLPATMAKIVEKTHRERNRKKNCLTKEGLFLDSAFERKFTLFDGNMHVRCL